MLRFALVPALALCAAAVAALETPLTIASGGKVGIIDPVYGSITIYEPSATKTDRLGLGKPSANFLADIDVGLKTYIDERDGVPFQALRLGTTTSKPTYREMFLDGKWLAKDPTPREKAAGKAALQTRASRAEDAFWKANPSYDGVVRAAYSNSGRYVALVIPSLHTLLVYMMDNETATLVAMRNWGPELFMAGYNSTPSPRDFLKELKGDKLKEAEAALGIDDEKADKGADAPPPAIDAEEPPTPKSDAWVAAGTNDSFLIVDVPNQHAMLYQISGKNLTLNAVRNLAVDMVVPGLIGGSWHCEPSSEKMLEAALRGERKAKIQEYDLPSDKDELVLLVQQSAGKGKASPFEGLMNNGIATLNFVEKRAFLTLDTQNGQKLALASARDYTLDIALALLDKQIIDRGNARRLVGDAATLAKQNKLKSAFLTAKLALGLDPRLHKDAEQKMKGEFRSNAELQAQFQALIDEAAKQAEELAKQAEERKKALEEQRKAKKDAGK
ncbi:MAG: hypothetical protein J0M02_14745 [Planctomycetes bacterium]|nr:hypothetical protein [Planctomycetota bacterium]